MGSLHYNGFMCLATNYRPAEREVLSHKWSEIITLWTALYKVV